MNDYAKMMPKMLSGQELINTLQVIPDYYDSEKETAVSERLINLSAIYQLYLPSVMSVEIYNKLYLATAMALRKKESKLMVEQSNSNFNGIQSGEYRGIIGGADSFSIIGTSGIGKSSAIERAARLISGGGIIETQKPLTKIILCLSVQCPYDCSPKGMLLEILRIVDSQLSTNYYTRSQRAGVTTDILIGTVSQVAINHIGLLIIDEIQHVTGHKNGRTLMAMLTQLINLSGISICMVGTPECISFFEMTMQLSRRSMGLRYTAIPCDDYFREFCKIVYGYQYVKKKSEITDGIIEWLYEHSAGVISVVISLIHDAQELSIFNGREVLDIQGLNEAFLKRLTMLHGYVAPEEAPEITKRQAPTMNYPTAKRNTTNYQPSNITIPSIVQRAKEEELDVVMLLKEQMSVTEVAI